MDALFKPLPHPDQFHLNAAFGWIELNNADEAEAELARIRSADLQEPLILMARWQICALRKEWHSALRISGVLCVLAADSEFGFIHFAYALHELKRTDEALVFLRGIARRFPENPIIPYNLACYACQLGKEKIAWQYLQKAAKVGGKSQLRKQALEDHDLLPLWPKIEAW